MTFVSGSLYYTINNEINTRSKSDKPNEKKNEKQFSSRVENLTGGLLFPISSNLWNMKVVTCLKYDFLRPIFRNLDLSKYNLQKYLSQAGDNLWNI